MSGCLAVKFTVFEFPDELKAIARSQGAATVEPAVLELPNVVGSRGMRPGAPPALLILVPTPYVGSATGKDVNAVLIDLALLHSAPRIGSVGE